MKNAKLFSAALLIVASIASLNAGQHSAAAGKGPKLGAEQSNASAPASLVLVDRQASANLDSPRLSAGGSDGVKVAVSLEPWRLERQASRAIQLEG